MSTDLKRRVDDLHAKIARLKGTATGSDFVEWANDRLQREGIQLSPWQEQFCTDPARRLSLMVPRQSGKSTCVALLALHTALSDARPLNVIAPSHRQSKLLAEKIRSYANDGDIVTSSAVEITVKGGGRIRVLPSEANTVRGISGHLVIDEAGFTQTDVAQAVLPSTNADPRFRTILLSTPSSPRGLFYESQQPDSGYSIHRYSIQDVGHYQAEALEALRKSLGEARWLVEMECNWAGASGALIGADIIKRAFGAFDQTTTTDTGDGDLILKGFTL